MTWPKWFQSSSEVGVKSSAAYRRESRLWFACSVVSVVVWVALSRLMFRSNLLPDDNLLLVVTFTVAMIFSGISFLYALAKYVASIAVK